MEQELQYMKEYIDTIGKNDPELTNKVDLENTKKLLQENLEKSLQEQQTSLENTLMEFKQNGVVYTTSIEGVDSAMYNIEDNEIKIDEAKLKGSGETMTFTILSLSNDTLKLQLVDYGDTSHVVLVPTK